MTEPIEAVLFDWGGVLIENPGPRLMAFCAEALVASVENYTTAHNQHGAPFQKGHISEAVFWQRVCKDLDRPKPQAPPLWGQAFRAVHSPRQEVFALAGQLREQGVKTALLSNTEAAAMQFFLEQQYDMFDALTFSCAEGTAKPQREIYDITARKLGIEPRCCAFIDDNPICTEAATEAGMRGIIYQNLEQVKDALKDLGVAL